MKVVRSPYQVKFTSEGIKYLKVDEKIQIIKLLISKGADVNLTNNIGSSALLVGSGFAQSEIIEILISKGSNLNQKGEGGLTPLMYAANKDKPKTIWLLLAKGADFKMKDEIGKTVMDYATGSSKRYLDTYKKTGKLEDLKNISG